MFDTKSVGFIADIHYGVDGQKPDAELERTVEQLNRADVSYVFVLGDLIHEPDPADYDESLARLDAVKSHLDDLDAPYSVTMGNHDVCAIDAPSFYTTFDQPQTDEIVVDETQYIIIDSASDTPKDNVGYIGQFNQSRLRTLLNKSNQYEKTVVCSHYPLMYTQSYQEHEFFGQYPEGVFPIDKREIEDDLIESVDTIVCGHMHMNWVWNSDGVTNICIGEFMEFPDFDPDPTAWMEYE
jgi:predicted phosphodiesterase